MVQPTESNYYVVIRRLVAAVFIVALAAGYLMWTKPQVGAFSLFNSKAPTCDDVVIFRPVGVHAVGMNFSGAVASVEKIKAWDAMLGTERRSLINLCKESQ